MKLRPTTAHEGRTDAPRQGPGGPPVHRASGAQPSPRRRRWRRVGRALVALSFVALLGGGWAYHRARAQVSESLMELGDRMMRYAHARRQDAPRDLVINGQVLRLSSGTTSRGATEVLDTFEARCAEVDGDLARQMERLRQEHPEAAGEVPSTPTLREDDGRRGYVTCLDLGPSAVSVAELSERLRLFGRTGDVADVGQIRYVFAEQMGEGAERSTHFVAMWTTGTFDVEQMFPERGDAPGRDLDDVDRPPDTRRVLSAWERTQPQALTVYSTPRPESELLSFYRRTLPARGWSLLEHPERDLDPNAPRTLVAERGQRMLTVVFGTDLESGRASAAVFEMR